MKATLRSLRDAYRVWRQATNAWLDREHPDLVKARQSFAAAERAVMAKHDAEQHARAVQARHAAEQAARDEAEQAREQADLDHRRELWRWRRDAGMRVN